MELEREEMSLTNIYGGGAVEMFDRALQEVLKNIMDENTTLDERTITLTAKFTPDEHRRHLKIVLNVKKKLCGQPNINIRAGVELNEKGMAVAIDYDQFQRKIPFGSGVVSINQNEEN